MKKVLTFLVSLCILIPLFTTTIGAQTRTPTKKQQAQFNCGSVENFTKILKNRAMKIMFHAEGSLGINMIVVNNNSKEWANVFVPYDKPERVCLIDTGSYFEVDPLAHILPA